MGCKRGGVVAIPVSGGGADGGLHSVGSAKEWRAPAAVFFYFTAMLLPYLGFFSLFAFRYSFVADHYQYLAAIGPIVIGAGLMDKAVGSVRGNGGVLKTAVTVMLLLDAWNVELEAEQDVFRCRDPVPDDDPEEPRLLDGPQQPRPSACEHGTN